MQDTAHTAFGRLLVFPLDVIGQDLRYAFRGLLMLITALLSCSAPAVRAARVDPATAFRTE